MLSIFPKALEKKEKYQEAFQTIANASLVDDMADSRSTKAEMQELITQLQEFFSRMRDGHTQIRGKFAVNYEGSKT
jgi:hypothetical protein